MPKSKRTRTGCLCCRRRHKKCDELKPSCKFCLSKGLKCEWPIKGSVFVNYQSNTTGQSSIINLNNTSSTDMDSQSSNSPSRKSSFDESSPLSTSAYKLSNVSLPPIKHYHMVIPRANEQPPPQQQQQTQQTQQQKLQQPKEKEVTHKFTTSAFKELTFNSFTKDVVPINFNTSKRLSVDSLLN